MALQRGTVLLAGVLRDLGSERRGRGARLRWGDGDGET